LAFNNLPKWGQGSGLLANFRDSVNLALCETFPGIYPFALTRHVNTQRYLIILLI